MRDDRVVLYRFGDEDGHGFTHARGGSKAEVLLLEAACVDIPCPREDVNTATGREQGQIKPYQRCWLTHEQLVRAAEKAFEGSPPSFLFTCLWSGDVPKEACTFLENQVLVEYEDPDFW